MPSGEIGIVRSLERNSQACVVARARDNVARLQAIEGTRVKSVDALCHPDFSVAVENHLELKVCNSLMLHFPPSYRGPDAIYHVLGGHS